MIKKVPVLFFTIIGIIFSGSAQADNQKNYVDIGYGWAAYEEAGWRFVPRILKVSAGTKVADNLAIEGMGALGIVDSSVGGLTLAVDSAYGLYAKPFVDVNDKFELYGRIGVVRISGTVSGSGGSIYGYDSAMSYGGGGAFKVSENGAVFLDYTVYYNKNGVYVYGMTSGLRFGF